MAVSIGLSTPGIDAVAYMGNVCLLMDTLVPWQLFLCLVRATCNEAH